jgi:hypothetical protein
MNRWIVLFAVFLLVFTGSGAHKTFAMTNAAQISVEVQMNKAHDMSQHEDCCDEKMGHSKASYGSCSVPCITIHAHGVVRGSSRSYSHDLLYVGIPNGVNSGLPKRPPKLTLT